MEENIIFGFPIINNKLKILNMMILFCKFYIYKSKIIKDEIPELFVFLLKLKSFLLIELTVNKENKKGYEELEEVIEWL